MIREGGGGQGDLAVERELGFCGERHSSVKVEKHRDRG